MEELLDFSNKSDNSLMSPSMEVELHVRRPNINNQSTNSNSNTNIVPTDIKSSVSSTDITTPDSSNFENISTKQPLNTIPESNVVPATYAQAVQPTQPTQSVSNITSSELTGRKTSKKGLKKKLINISSNTLNNTLNNTGSHLFELYGYQIPYETLFFVLAMILIAIILYFYLSPEKKMDDEEN